MKLKNELKYRPLLMLAIVSLFAYSCNDENQQDIVLSDDNAISEELVGDVSDDADVDAVYEEVDDLALAGMEYDFDGNEGGRTEHDRRFDCAEVSREEIEDGVIITIDFGDGCVGPNGIVRSGIIQITKIGHYWQPGSSSTTELFDFTVDSVEVEGTVVVSNISESIESVPVFSYQLIGGKLTWTDGTFATRDARGTRTIYHDVNPIGDEVHIDGSAEGVNRRGVSCSMVITTPLVIKRECDWRRHPIPVSGVKEITKGDDLIVIDFGDGECDNIVRITKNGVTEEREIKFRRHRGN